MELGKAPYSKSHTRRMKRKAKEDIAGGLSDIQTALFALEETFAEDSQAQANDLPYNSAPSLKSSSSKASQIGQGKNVPLSKNQRKRTLSVQA